MVAHTHHLPRRWRNKAHTRAVADEFGALFPFAAASLVEELVSVFVAPALLGGNFAKMLGTLVEEQIMSVFDWPFGAAIATVLIVIVLVINLAYVYLVERRFPAPGHVR